MSDAKDMEISGTESRQMAGSVICNQANNNVESSQRALRSVNRQKNVNIADKETEGQKKGRGRPSKKQKMEKGDQSLTNFWYKNEQKEISAKEKGSDNETTNGETDEASDNDFEDEFTEEMEFSEAEETIMENNQDQDKQKEKENEFECVENKILEEREWREKWEAQMEEKWERRMAELEQTIKVGLENIDSGNKNCGECKKRMNHYEKIHNELKKEIQFLKQNLADKEDEIDSLRILTEKTVQREKQLRNQQTNVKMYSEALAIEKGSIQENIDTDKQNERNQPPKGFSGEMWEEEKKIRWERKKNIIVKGLTLLTKERKEEFEKWTEEILQIKVKVNHLERVQEGWKIKLEEWAMKQEIMRKKKMLNFLGWGVQIKDDFTERQNTVQEWLRMEAKEWRLRGKTAKVRYQKLMVDDVWLKWNELEGILQLSDRKQGSRFFRAEKRSRTGVL
ncbi:uncharacterized protein LOC127289665 [Leptopilina boulardi]|uniref:uncharacterized protein LOC127289665 n=1 Tax=Leptopilina boulardi TaxID=63433 RepID=UPI0021F69121|nr:uncharacterized protein LOC127289665 [Leptopilina boulardi]